MAVKKIATIQRFTGLASDTKPAAAPAGSEFYEYDTNLTYITYDDGSNWIATSIGEGNSIATAAAVMSNALTVFTIAGGPIVVTEIVAVCATANDGTASTLLFYADPTDGAATNLCAASASLANAAAGSIVNITGTLANAGVLTATGTAIGQAGNIVVPVGVIGLTVAVGSTTGTWSINMGYRPLGRAVTVVAAY